MTGRRFRIEGSPTPEEEGAVLAALERVLRGEEERRRPSAWRLAGRAASAHVGLAEMRQRFGRSRWALTHRITWAGEGPQDLRGRGDAK